jgi:rhodanese-related sulfurtransferase
MAVSKLTVVALVEEGLGNSSYLVELGEGRALVVDPPRDPTRHLGAAEKRGVVISNTGSLCAELDAVPDGPITLLCGHGERAMTGASILAAAGRQDVSVLVGGSDDWARVAGTTLAT